MGLPEVVHSASVGAGVCLLQSRVSGAESISRTKDLSNLPPRGTSRHLGLYRSRTDTLTIRVCTW